jgi:hypothetical protein
MISLDKLIQAEKEQKDYLKLIDEEVQELFRRNNWNLKYSQRKGGYLERDILYQETE